MKTQSIISKEKLDPIILDSIVIPKFSYFLHPISNTIPYDEVSLINIYDLLKTDLYKGQTEKLRSIKNPESARKFKLQNFDCVTFSGIFSKRKMESLIQHSELLTLDFDHVQDLGKLKKALLLDEYFDTELMFVSPSGNGIKWIISIDIKMLSHKDWFRSISAYIKSTYNHVVDKSGSDISRACFLPYDPEVYINPNYFQL